MAGPRPLRRGAPAPPARPSRRARAPVNYAEDLEDDFDAPAASNEVDEDSDLLFPPSEDDEPAARRQRKRPSPTRKSQPAKRRKTAVEKSRPRKRSRSISSLESDSNTESDSDLPLMRRTQQKKPKPKKEPHMLDYDGPVTPPKELEMFKSEAIDPMLHSERKIPAWNSLPYLLLKNIFSFVGAPLLDERTFEATPNFKSVLNASKVCRSWNEAALTMLWQDPVLVPMERAHLLSKILEIDPKSTIYNYRQKLLHLTIDVNQSAEYTLSGVGKLDLASLVFHCPRLSTLEICHNKDFAPYRHLDEFIKWTYPPELFGALAENCAGRHTELKSWRWSSRLVSKAPNTGGYDFTLLNTVHMMPSFQSLTKLGFVNYQTPDLPRRKPPGFVMPETQKNLADTISLLPNLKNLVFEACGVVNGTLLPLLTTNLEHLEIIACGELVSDDFAEFLLTHGSNLKSLVLDHNQALSLSWLTILKEACPKLEHLSCNLAYYNLHGTYKDNEPTFSSLLGNEEIPTWPSTLQSLELVQLRKWEARAAENLFNSLLNAAGDLKDLRTLIIKAILDSISWRDRGGFRDRWMKSFSYVFKRRSPGPVPYLSSFGAHTYYLGRLARADREKQEPILITRDVDIQESILTGERKYVCPIEKETTCIVHVPEGVERPRYTEDEIVCRKHTEGRFKGVYVGRRRRECEWLKEQEDRGMLIRHVEPGDGDGEGGFRNGGKRKRSRVVEVDSDDEPLAKTTAKRKRPSIEDDSDDEPLAKKLATPKRRRGIEEDSDDEPIAKRMLARKTRAATTPKKKLEVLIDGRSTVTPGGTRYGGSPSGSRASSNEVDTSYHSEESISKDQVIQGMCNVVELRIDNLRPTENQFTEADFLDDEPEEDDEWNGEDRYEDDFY